MKHKFAITAGVFIAILLFAIFIINFNPDQQSNTIRKSQDQLSVVEKSYFVGNTNSQVQNHKNSSAPTQIFSNFETNTDNSLIDLNLVLPGGPGKDGIPAISDPKFVDLGTYINQYNVDTENDLGIAINIAGQTRFYPYSILVWHEIVNDQIDDNHFAITFCPLCGSAIVYNREVNSQVLEFKVSGLLYESNLLMYDTQTETLWSQIEGRAVVGEKAGSELQVMPMDVLSFSQLQTKYPQAQIMSQNTGYTRNYNFYPYGDYENDNNLLFDVQNLDSTLPPKTIVYAFQYEDTPVAIIQENLRIQGEVEMVVDQAKLKANYNNGTIEVIDNEGNLIPGYYAMWFSWANHNY